MPQRGCPFHLSSQHLFQDRLVACNTKMSLVVCATKKKACTTKKILRNFLKQIHEFSLRFQIFRYTLKFIVYNLKKSSNIYK